MFNWLEMHNGFLAEGVSGIADDTPQESYYGIQMDSTIARIGDALVSSTSNNSLVSVHAISRTDGKEAFEFINKDPANSATVNVNVANATLASSGTRYDFGTGNFPAGSGWATSGISSSTFTGIGQSSFTITVPAYTISSVVVQKTAVPDFSISVGGGHQTVLQNGSTVSTITISRINGFTGSIAFRATGLTKGLTGTIVNGPNKNSKTMTIFASASAQPRICTITVTATSGSLTHSQSFLLSVESPTLLFQNSTAPILNLSSGDAIDDPSWSESTGALIQQWTVTGGGNQSWTLTNLGDNVVELVNSFSGLALSVVSGSVQPSGSIDQETYTGATSQQWLIAPAPQSGCYLLQNVNSGLALSVPGSSTTAGTLLDQEVPTGATSQSWKL